MKHRYYIFSIFICFLLVVSCKEEIVPPSSYETPTALGYVELPTGCQTSCEDIYIRVKETGKNFKVGSDGHYIISGLEEGKRYTLYFQNMPFFSESRSIANRSVAMSDSEIGEKLNEIIGAKVEGIIGTKGSGYDNGIAILKKTAAVKGKINIEKNDSDCSGISVYIPDSLFITTTAPDGSFALIGLVEGKGYTLNVECPRYLPAQLGPFDVVIDPEGTNIIDLSSTVLKKKTGGIEGYISVDGSVTSADFYESLKVIAVNEEDSTVNYTFCTDGNSFSHDDIQPGTYRLEIKLDGFKKAIAEHVVVDVSNSVLLQESIQLIPEGGSISGIVKLQNSTDCSGISVNVNGVSNGISYKTQTDIDGNFSIPAVVPGEYSIELLKTSYGSTTVSVIAEKGKNASSVSVQLGMNTGTVSGFVKVDDEKSLADINVIAIHESGVATSTVTDKYGAYSFKDILHGKVELKFSKKGYDDLRMLDFSVRPSADNTCNVTLKSNTGSLHGDIHFSEGKLPSLVEVKVTHENGIILPATVDIYGHFDIPFCPEGKYTVEVKAKDYSKKTQEVEVYRKLPAKIEFYMTKSVGSIEGAVHPRGEILDKTILNQIKVNIISEVNPALIYTANVKDGVFYADDIERGLYNIEASLPGYRKAILTHFEIKAAAHTSVEGVMELIPDGGNITGRINIESNTDKSGIKVIATNSDKSVRYITETIKDGSYLIEQCLLGAYDINFLKEDYIPFNYSLFLDKVDDIYEVPCITLKQKSSSIVGQIQLEEMDDYSGCSVSLYNIETNTEIENYITQSNGSYYFKIFQKGNYIIRFSKRGYNACTSGVINITLDEDINLPIMICSKTVQTELITSKKCVDILSQNIKLELDDFPLNLKKNITISFYSEFDSFSEIIIGKGYRQYRGRYLRITSTDIEDIYYGDDKQEEICNKQNHNMSISKYIMVTIMIDDDSICTVNIKTLGYEFEYRYNWGYEFNNTVFVIGKQDLRNLVFSANPGDLSSNVWLFGDSYFGCYSTRVIGQLFELGCKKGLLIDGLAGQSSEEAFKELDILLQLGGQPKYVVWCLGMNDYYNNYKEIVGQLIAMQKQYNFVLVLQTIPVVPSRVQDLININNYIKESGLKYIDACKAVGADETGEWYPQYLSPDKIHPTKEGAKAIAMRMLIDFPEIMFP